MPGLTQNFINPETQALVRRLDWQLSTEGMGRVAQGADDIAQCILLAVTNNKGSDPFRPDFGSDIWEHIDTPLPIAAPNMVLAISQAVERWEPRVALRYVEYEYVEQADDMPGLKSGIIFNIGWRLRGGNVDGQTDLLLGLDEVSTPDVPLTAKIIILGTEAGEALTTESGQVLRPDTGNVTSPVPDIPAET